MEKAFNLETMVDYYEKIDVIREKYKNLLEFYSEDIGESTKEKIYRKRYLIFSTYENMKQFSEFTKRQYRNLKLNLDMVYEDKTVTEHHVKLYELFCEKIITQYINIDGIERLFSSKYADFEWEMHLGMNHAKNDMTYYRDHFIHQLKNAYMMDVLLYDFDFMSKIKNILKDKGRSKISNYTMKMLEQQLSIPKDKVFIEFETKYNKLLEEHFLENIIRMSCYMAGIFHDIGYPSVRELKENRRIADYIIESYHFDGGQYDFNQIMALLQNSLLFRVVSAKEIRRRLEGDMPDHGVVSALLFLLQFYENGAIHRLSPYKICAIELAALAIYNHNNKYASTIDDAEKAAKAEYDRCVFSLNPITYLLKICDDLQEWGRIYFEISNKQKLILCNKCHLPMIRTLNQNKKEFMYNCGCEETIFEPMFPANNFPGRRIYNVTVCDELVINDENNVLTFELKYRLDRLLQIAYISPTYAKIRIKELNNLKKFFDRQDQIGKVYVGYIMSPNIILLKGIILRRYMEYVLGEENDICNLTLTKKPLDIDEFIKRSDEFIHQNDGEKFCSVNEFIKDKTTLIETQIDLCITIYMFVANLIELRIKNIISDKSNDIIKIMEEFIQKINIIQPNFIDSVAEDLLKDCAYVIAHVCVDLNDYKYYPEKYYKAFESSKDINLIDRCKQFINTETFEFPKKSNDLRFDAYTDLSIFKNILNELQDKNLI